jgi:AraC-like DNA-binding protein
VIQGAIVALLVDRTARARVQAATRGVAELLFADRVDDVWETISTRLVTTVVLQPRDAAGVSVAPLVERLRATHPSISLIAYAALTPGDSRDILELARAGVHELVIRGFDDAGVRLRVALAHAQELAAASEVLRELERDVPRALQPFVRYCLERAAEAPSVGVVARAMGVHRKTLVNRARAAGLPSPLRLIGWCRLLLAARLLEDPGRRVEQVALWLEFPSATSLRNMLKRYVGLRPSELRERGGWRAVLEAMRRAIRARRQRAPAR